MITIIVNKWDILDLPEKVSISMVKKSPMFSEMGDYSFPFSIPATHKNRSILGFKNRVENNGNIYQTYYAELHWNGNALFIGTLKVTEANNNSYQCALYIDKGNLVYTLKGTKLNEMDLGEMIFSNQSEALDFFNDRVLIEFYPDQPFALPQVANEFYIPDNDDDELFAYNYQSTGQLRLTSNLGNRMIIVPFLYLQYVLRRVFSELGYTYVDYFFTQTTELYQLVLYNSSDANFRQVYYRVEHLIYNNHVPMMEVMKFLHELQKWFNCTFFIDDKRKNVSCKGNNDCLLGEQSLLLYDDLSSNILSVNHVIETKVRGMKLESQGDTGDAAWQLVKDEEAAFEAYFRGAVDTLADLQAMTWPNIMDIYYVIDEEAWYQLQLDPTTFLPDWKALVVPPYIFSYYLHKWPTDLTITTQFSSLVNKGVPVYCSNLAAEYRNISPRLFFINRGVIPGDSHTTTYGMNLNDHLNLQMMNNAFYHSPGMFERFHKDWADWIIGRRKLVKVRKQIHFSELDIDFSKKYLLLGNKYFIKEMRVTLNNERIMPAELDLYLV